MRLASFVASDAFAKAILIISLCAIFYSLGAATILFEAFPYKQLRNVAEGFRARLAMDNDRLPIGFVRWENTVPSPVSGKGAGEEFILIAGGPYRRLDLCPTHGCLAWIIDRKGRVLHKWEVDYNAIIADDEVHVGRLNARNLTPIGLSLGSDGSLIVTFHGRNLFPYQVGIAKVGREGEVVWVRHDLSHHWPDVREDGVIFAPFAKVAMNKKKFGETALPFRCRTGAVYDEGVRAISSDGTTLLETSFLDLLNREDFPGLFYGVLDGCDPLHVNSVDIAGPDVEHDGSGVEPGDLLVSLREPSAIVLLDQDASRVKRMIVGRSAAQHSARFLKYGDIVVFDNQGGKSASGGSRVLKLSLDGTKSDTLYPKADGASLRSLYQGHVEVSPDYARLLVVSSGEGRIIEIDARDGRELWRHVTIEPTDQYRAQLGVSPKGPSAHYALTGAYYVRDASFLKPS